MEQAEQVYKVVKRIPKGYVLTYGDIAKLAGVKNPRTVGQILHKNPDQTTIPCHRVVNASGQLSRNFAFGGIKLQANKLIKEGVEVKNYRVDLKKFLWV